MSRRSLVLPRAPDHSQSTTYSSGHEWLWNILHPHHTFIKQKKNSSQNHSQYALRTETKMNAVDLLAQQLVDIKWSKHSRHNCEFC